MGYSPQNYKESDMTEQLTIGNISVVKESVALIDNKQERKGQAQSRLVVDEVMRIISKQAR